MTEASGWRPISEAPKDGRRIALAVMNPRICQWVLSEGYWWNSAVKPFFVFDGHGRYPQPTHWTDLPPQKDTP